MSNMIPRSPSLFGQSYSMATLAPTASATRGSGPAIATDTASFSSAAVSQATQAQALRDIHAELAAISQQIAAIQAQFAARTPAAPAPKPPAQKAAPEPTPAPVETKKPEPAPKPEPQAEAPKAALKPEPEAPKPATYTVRSGDSLSAIAQRTLGDGGRWHEIFELNRDTIGNPDEISPGQTLKLPTGAKARAENPTPQPAAPAPSKGGPITDRGRLYMTQPNGWTCGPTSLTMAAAAFGLRPVGVGTVNELVDRTGTTPDTGIPNRNAIPKASAEIGLHSEPAVASSPDKVRAAIKAGHGVIQNGSLGSGGHYIYLAGLNPDGSFIVCDPARSSITSWNDSELTAFMNREPGHDIMFEVWR